MASNKFTKQKVQRMGILWVLLNITTEFRGDSKRIVDVMNEIEKACPEARRMWNSKFSLVIDDEIIYMWNGNK
jgi:hypothetical protein